MSRSFNSPQLLFSDNALLGVSGVFASAILKIENWQQVQTNIVSDVSGTLTIEFMRDSGGTDILRTLTIPYAGGSGFQMFSAPCFTPYVKYTYTNGSTGQADFYLDTKGLKSGLSPQVLGADAFISSSMVATLSRSILVGQDNAGNFNNASVEGGTLLTADYFHSVAEGRVTGESLVHKFGKDESVETTYTPIAIGGIFRTPQIAAATTLRVKAGNTNDTAAGSGAQEVTLEYIDTSGNLITEALATAGTSASSATAATAIRLVRAYVSKSGTYATAAAGSHAANIVIENSAGTEDWATILVTDFPRSQTQIGVYTVPLGFTAYVYEYNLTTDGKACDFLFFQRQSILDTGAPYSGMRAVIEHVGIADHWRGTFKGGQSFPALTDIGWMCKGAASPIVTVDFEILLVAD